MIVIRELQARSILGKSSLPVADYAANPYVGCEHACKYCYASFMKRFTNHPEPWGSFIDVKIWPPLRNPQKYAGREVFFGSVTDPYQPAEEKYRRTRALLEQLKGSGCHLSIATKSDLILRDLDLLRSFPAARVAFSINTLDETFRQEMDQAAPIERRIAAMAALHEAGIHTTCFISPIFPQITNPREIILKTQDFCDLVWLETLNLRGAYKPAILNYISQRRPNLLNLYKDIYVHGNRGFWRWLDEDLRQFARAENFTCLRHNEPLINQNPAKPMIVNYFFHDEVAKAR